jgi:hypothetical protein
MRDGGRGNRVCPHRPHHSLPPSLRPSAPPPPYPQRLLFPFTGKRWSRVAASEASNGGGLRHPGMQWAPPVQDENAPDLYIPLMAFVTYVLVCGLLKGTRMKFTPETLVTSLSSGLLSAILEVTLLKAAMYALAVDGASLVRAIMRALGSSTVNPRGARASSLWLPSPLTPPKTLSSSSSLIPSRSSS